MESDHSPNQDTTPPTASDGSASVSGQVRRVAILTVMKDPYIYYVADHLRDTGVEVRIFNQTNLKVRMGSWAHFKRLRKNRGLRVAADVMAYRLARTSVMSVMRLLRGKPKTSSMGNSTQQAWSMASYPPAVRESVESLAGGDWPPVTDVVNINRPPGQDALIEWAPDLLILAGAPIVSKTTIAAASVACLNAHCGITPDYCGSSPVEWAIYERRFEDVGYTVHVVEPAVDAGPIIHQERVPWDASRRSSAAMQVIGLAMYDRLLKVCHRLIAGEAVPTMPQAKPRSMPPAGLLVRLLADRRRKAYARRQAGSAGS